MRYAPATLAFVAVTWLVSACAPFLSFPWPVEPVGTPLPFPGPSASANPVAVFDVVGETFRIELVGTDNLVHAQALLAGGTDAPIPSGVIVRGDAGVNAPWSWHIDPATVEWADMTTEVCDGTPSQIEDGTFTYERFCPWSARVIAIEPADN
jgi:hypothetical protein